MRCLEIETLTMSTYSRCDAFSLAADAIAEAILIHDSNNDIDMVLNWLGEGKVEVSFPALQCYRRVYSQKAEKIHIEYLEKSKLNTFTSIVRADFCDVLGDIEGQKPLEAVQLISSPESKGLLKIQRDGKVFERALSCEKNLGIEFFMDESSFKKAQSISSNSSSEFIGISSQFNNIILKTEYGVSSFLTLGSDEFLQKKLIETENVIDFIVDGYLLKNEASAYIKLNDIKQQEQSFLLFYEGYLMFCSISESVKCAKILKLNNLSLIGFSAAFMANLNSLNKLKVKNITEFHEMSTALTKTNNGDYSLSFFSGNDKKNPYFSVTCTSAPNRKNDLIKIYEEYPIESKDWCKEDT